MTKKSLTLVVATILMLTAVAIGAAPASAGGVNSLIKDASDGVVDGTYSASTTRAALAVVRGDPAYAQYSDVEGVLVDYLASITHTGTPKPNPTRTGAGASSGGTSNGGTPAANGRPSASAKPHTTLSPASSSPGAGTSVTVSPPPDTSSSGQVTSRLGAVWWFFIALAAGAMVVGVVLVRRRSK